MKAATLAVVPSPTLDLRDIDEPLISRPDEVIVEVDACGVCGTDIHILEGTSYRPDLPFVMGHEPVGVVVDAGAQAREWEGHRVTATLFEGCSTCAWCDCGDERICPKLRSILGVLGRPGAFAERFVVPARQLVPVPKELSSQAAAALVDSGATAMNAVTRLSERNPRSVAVIGGGAVGLLVAELLATQGRTLVIAESRAPRRAELAARGHAVVGDLDEAEGSFDCIVECSGAAAPLRQACERLDPRGLVILAGYAVAPAFDFAPVARKELTIQGVRSGGREDLVSVLEAAAAGRITPPRTSHWALRQVNEALSAMRSGAVEGKAVIIPR